MVQIEIDEDVYAWLKQHAEPFVETTPNLVLRRHLGLNRSHGPVTSEKTVQLEKPTQWVAKGTRPMLNERALHERRVKEFVVGNTVPDYSGTRAHPRAYLDGMIAAGKWQGPYFERWSGTDQPNPRGDAAARVILQVGEKDRESLVRFDDGRPEMPMAEFIKAFLHGNL
jgi:hypothetical protein